MPFIGSAFLQFFLQLNDQPIVTFLFTIFLIVDLAKKILRNLLKNQNNCV